MPALVTPGDAIVGGNRAPLIPGANAFASPKSRILIDPSGRSLMFAGLKIAMDDAAIVRGLQTVAELHRGEQRLANGQGPRGEAIRQRVAFDELHHDDRGAGGILDAKHLGDVGGRARRAPALRARSGCGDRRRPARTAAGPPGRHLAERGIARRETLRPFRLRQRCGERRRPSAQLVEDFIGEPLL